MSLNAEEGGGKGEIEGDVTTEEWLERSHIAGLEDGGREPRVKGYV